jgi:MoxR-like ATPase
MALSDPPKNDQPMEQVLYEVKKIIVGQDHLLERMIVALLSRGHILVEGVPGLAKTMAIKTLAEAIGGEFKRIQFTPDLVPADLVGTRIYNQKQGEFNTSLGPVFTNLLLADEINRAPAKVQSALLEVMQEHQVTIGRESYPVPDPFLVLATQNPIEQEGTYPLPEAQQDRFMFKVLVTYPSFAEEFEVARRTTSAATPQVEAVLSPEEILQLQELVRSVPISDHLIRYSLALVRQTRVREEAAADFAREQLAWGAGPRATQFLILGAKARALVRGRPHVALEDIRALAKPVLRHRLVVNFAAESDGITTDHIVDRLLEVTPTHEDQLLHDDRFQKIFAS